MKRLKSEELFARALSCMPGGVNSPVRAFRAVGGNPVFVHDAKGAHLRDVDGNLYLDFVCSWGPLILGHAHPDVVAAIQEFAQRGSTYGAPSYVELELVETIRQAVPSMEMLRLVSSGTEATMSALRVARGFTGKQNIIKFEGCYHGHHDSLLTAAGSGVATFDLPDSAGVPPGFSKHTITLPYNNLDALKSLSQSVLDDTAAMILEPIAANMGLIPPEPEFLRGLRDFTRSRGILLIFDEVITGFRLAYGGAQAFYSIEPDLTCLGKIIGGGLPLAAYGGRHDVMSKVAPLGPVYQAGTLSGNPVAAAAGLATLKILQRPGSYRDLNRKAQILLEPIHKLLKKADLRVSLVSLGSMFTLFFRPEAPRNFREAKQSDTSGYARFFWSMLESGLYFAPSQFETNFISLAHEEEDLRRAFQTISEALSALKS
jgi:glutamate-1-semialdehyde 2,1-aminomutase